MRGEERERSEKTHRAKSSCPSASKHKQSQLPVLRTIEAVYFTRLDLARTVRVPSRSYCSVSETRREAKPFDRIHPSLRQIDLRQRFLSIRNRSKEMVSDLLGDDDEVEDLQETKTGE